MKFIKKSEVDQSQTKTGNQSNSRDSSDSCDSRDSYESSLKHADHVYAKKSLFICENDNDFF